MPERGVSEKHLTSALPPLKARQEEVYSNSIPNKRDHTQKLNALHPLSKGRGFGLEIGNNSERFSP
jgi:hypothetical protein